MGIKYLVIVSDYDSDGYITKDVKKRKFNNLSAAQHFSNKMLDKVQRRGEYYKSNSNWGGIILKNNYSHNYHPIRRTTIKSFWR